ncbi:S9 family peptidase [Tsuneonella sp. CC-YZS046]|uniref:S9 family peptidase n=1 Tax=Tsuneonella sp. CC-YZS046 TaxID=3042152 RepID=UPI002D799AED|nr:S9 family peptidase [Tsuneonella sp. CC-YZS046]WRO67132.1 S9 family peptidase [Tsuneonella sp. CC-YZS046]
MNRLLLLGALLASTPASAMARPMTPEDVARIEAVGQIAISPDGQAVAYTTARLPDITRRQDDGRARQQLKLAWGADHGRDYLPADMNVSAVRFSPDGKTISFIWQHKDGKEAVWGIPVDGGGHRKLAEIADANVLDYRWAPNGTVIYLLAEAETAVTRENEKKAGFNAIVVGEEPRFNRLFAAQAGKKPDTQPRPIALPGQVSLFEISPDGREAIVQSAPTPSVDDSYTSKRVQFVDLTTGKVRRVVETTGKIDDMEIAPDGRTLSLIAATDENDPAPTTLYLVDSATGALRPLNQGAAEAAVDAEYLADGRLAAVVHKGARSVLRFYDAAGRAVQEIDTGDLVATRLKSAGGRLAVRASSASHPAELFVLEEQAQGQAQGQALRRWTSHNPWLAQVELGRQRTMTYTARDGQRIEGILIEPVGGLKRGGAPTILDVHGGPEAHESNGWITDYSSPGQVAAGRGYAVFLPNYRGSTAYGTEFSKQHQGDYAGKEFNDLLDARKALVEQGIADPARVGITGGSYGGYAAAWAATALSENFAAAVMFVGVSNLISKLGTTEIPREMYLVHSRKWPWEDWQAMLERSPIYHAGKARTPLLILHGRDDSRVDPGQSLELYQAIRLRTATPVRLVLYPGEGHGNRRAAARYDYNLRMMEWFDRYLSGTGAKDGNALPPPRPELRLQD